MSLKEIEILKRTLERERKARKAAEKILEEKSLELYNTSVELQSVNKKLENLLNEKTTQLQGVFENINDAYVVIDLSGNVLKMNDIAENLFEYDIDKEPLNVVNLIYPDDYTYAMTSYKELKEEGHFSDYTARIVTKNKNVKWVQINASIIYDEHKKPLGAQGVARNVTHIKALEKQKEIILKELKNSNKELQEYAHIVSHDLKSPLRSISALVSWIKSDNEGKLDEMTLQNFNLIDTTLETMEKLISDILEYSSAGADTHKEEDINLNSVLENLKKVLFIPDNFCINVLNTLPTVKGDVTKFQQLFQNFISNAIKFCDKEKGFVEIDCLEKPTFYQFSIRDNGIGIEEKYHTKIFQVFHSLNKREDSSGIGLSIIKKIIDLYEGDIWLESQVNEGTTFYFTIKKY
ncbi:sensor histidine kinase [Polaribacter aquimarinus]|uniref:histidine kinase n=1 Tax=Polaribacter aquimarinus TaxID=2100726 RepID=A0A2U2JEQ0_9FLAO|nr:ATP-binding protein [Polaribacter aquimarinus]PWG06782.1 PAS domain-containing sensor histidine kinase [Polaribacter aquimarinus]